MIDKLRYEILFVDQFVLLLIASFLCGVMIGCHL